jgi:hypothetical protein
MKPLFKWWAWLALWQRSQVVFVIIWTLFLMLCAGYIYSQFQQEHSDNLRLQQIIFSHTGKVLK